MPSSHEEWFRQADYDMGTAELMHSGGRSPYAVLMCHLALEKAAKGLFQLRFDEVAPQDT